MFKPALHWGLVCLASSHLALAGPPCGLSGSPSVLAESGAMLRLGDVQGCEGVRFEVIPGVMIEGQPAVRLLAEPGSGCTVAGAGSVVIGGETAKRQGDVNCP